MNRVTATTVGYPFLFMLIAVSSLDASGKVAMGILLSFITAAVIILSLLKQWRINAILSGLLATVFACFLFAGVDMSSRHGYSSDTSYETHLVGTVVEEPRYNEYYEYIIKADDGRRVLFKSNSLSDGALYSRFEGNVTVVLLDSDFYGARFSATASDESQCIFTEGERGVLSIISDIRAWSKERIDSISDGQSAEFLKGVLLGDEAAIGSDLKRNFRATGLSHVLVISGSHFSIVLMALTALFTSLRGKRRHYYLIALLLMFAYMVLVGFGESVVRAGVSSLVIGLSFILSRDSDSVNSLGTAAIIVGLINPYTVVSIGFQLSFFSAFGIVTVGAHAVRRIKQLNVPKILKGISTLFVITVTAQLFTLPVLIPIYSEYSLMSVITNIVIGFAVDAVVILGLIYLILSAVWLKPIAAIFGFVTSLLARYCVSVADAFASNPLAVFSVPRIVFAVVLLVVAGTASLWYFFGKKVTLAAATVIVLSLAACVGATVYYNSLVKVTSVAGNSFIVRRGGNAVVVSYCDSRYDGEALAENAATLGAVDVKLIVGEDEKNDALVQAICSVKPTAVMAPTTERLQELCSMGNIELFDFYASVAPFDGCRVINRGKHTLVEIDGIVIAVADNYGYVSEDTEADVMFCLNRSSGFANTAVVMKQAKPLALSANRVYNANSNNFTVTLSRSGKIISVN